MFRLCRVPLTRLRATVVRALEAFSFWRCERNGHDYLMKIDETNQRIYLKCNTCDHETKGWQR